MSLNFGVVYPKAYIKQALIDKDTTFAVRLHDQNQLKKMFIDFHSFELNRNVLTINDYVFNPEADALYKVEASLTPLLTPVAFDSEVLLSARFGKDYVDKLLENRVDDEEGVVISVS